MPAPYSDDLREKVMAAIHRGEKKSRVIQLFEISRDTIDRWLKRQTGDGKVEVVQGYQRGHSHRIKDWDAFRTFVQQHGDKTQAEMAALWSGEISPRTISRGLAKIGFTRKKKRMATENETLPNAPHF